MKKLTQLLFTLVLALAYANANAQSSLKQGIDSMIQQKFLLNEMVPDIPAFVALNGNPSDFLKPSAPRDLAVMLSSFRSGGQFIIPKSFAAEFAPGLFASTKINLHDYRNNYWLRTLTKTRLSLATRFEDQTQFSHLAAGIKFTLIDKGDYRTDTAFLQREIYTKLDEYEKQLASRKLAYLKKNNITALELAQNETLGALIEDSLQLSLIGEEVRQSVENYKRSNWNATRMEFAYTLSGSSGDSLLQDAQINAHRFWLVYALKPGARCEWAQVIFGVHNTLQQAPTGDWLNQFSAGGRGYFGTNKAKGFAELQYKSQMQIVGVKAQQSMLINFGLDLDIYKGVWVHIASGVNNILGEGARTQFMGNMSFYLTLPENFSLF
jgi:hypothetical protein